MASFELRRLAIPSVCFLIAVLAYGSQILFHYLEPGPLTTRQAWIFNALVACIWLSYERTCRLDPGRLPLHLQEKLNEDAKLTRGQRWCQKCNAVKPPRAHHCKQCARLVNYFLESSQVANQIPDAFQRWIIIVLGLLNASHIPPFLIFFDSFYSHVYLWPSSIISSIFMVSPSTINEISHHTLVLPCGQYSSCVYSVWLIRLYCLHFPSCW